MSKFTLQYLPLFFEDMENIVFYIRDELENPKAANDLIDQVEQAILDRQKAADSFEVYHSVKERKYPYYRICFSYFYFGSFPSRKTSIISFVNDKWSGWPVMSSRFTQRASFNSSSSRLMVVSPSTSQ